MIPTEGGGGLAEAQLEAPQISIDLLSTTEDSDAKIELSFLGATAQVAYDASAQQLRHVLESMPSIGSVDVTSSHSLAVSGTWWWTVTFLETGDPAHLHDIELIAATILPPYEDTWQVDVNEVVAGFAEADEIRVFANDYGKSSHGEVPWDKDGSAYVSRSFNVYASPVADFPYIISAPGSRHRVLDIEEDTPFAMKEIDVNIEFVDDNVYGISASVTIQLICEHGSFTMKSVEGDVISGKTIVVSRTVNDLNAMLATTVYTPDPDWHGFEEITLKSQDEAGNAGEELIFYIHVNAAPDAPVINAPTEINVTVNVDETPILIPGVQVTDVDCQDYEDVFQHQDLQVFLWAEHGEIYFSNDAQLLMNTSNTSPSVFTFSGGIKAVNIILGNIAYIPDTQFEGGDIINITIGDYPISETLTSTTQIVKLNVIVQDLASHVVFPEEYIIGDEDAVVRLSGVYIDEQNVAGNKYTYSVRIKVGNGTLGFDGHKDSGAVFTGFVYGLSRPCCRI